MLTISSEKEEENAEEEEKFTKREFSYQAFKRSFTLPEKIDDDHITAKYENGILNITIPKKVEEQPKSGRQIEVK